MQREQEIMKENGWSMTKGFRSYTFIDKISFFLVFGESKSNTIVS